MLARRYNSWAAKKQGSCLIRVVENSPCSLRTVGDPPTATEWQTDFFRERSLRVLRSVYRMAARKQTEREEGARVPITPFKGTPPMT
jgi:hypothetical protein